MEFTNFQKLLIKQSEKEDRLTYLFSEINLNGIDSLQKADLIFLLRAFCGKILSICKDEKQIQIATNYALQISGQHTKKYIIHVLTAEIIPIYKEIIE